MTNCRCSICRFICSVFRNKSKYFVLVPFVIYLLYFALSQMELLYLHYSDAKISYDCDKSLYPKKEMNLSGVKYAGCLIEEDNKFIMIDGAFSFEDIKRWGKVLFPAGTVREGEFPICTAIRETKEEIGLSVKVVELLNINSYGFALFLCKSLNLIDDKAMKYKKTFEVRKLLFIDKKDILDGDGSFRSKFRYSEDLDLLQKYVLSL